MPYADAGDIRLYYEESGSGESIVFLHGFTLDHRMWGGQAEYFKSSFRVIVPDSRGHGKSDAPSTGYSRDNRVEDLVRFVDFLKLDRFHLVGLSMGGATAIGFGIKHQDRLRSLTLVSTGAAGYKFGKDFSRFDRMAKDQGLEVARQIWKDMSLAWFTGKRSGPRDLMATMIDEHSGAVWMDPMRGKYVTAPDLDNVHIINVPTLIVAGERDKVFVPLSEEIHKRISGSKLVLIPHAGHMLNLEYPEEFNRILEEHLDSV